MNFMNLLQKKLCYDLGYFKNSETLMKKINFLIKNYDKIYKNKMRQNWLILTAPIELSD